MQHEIVIRPTGGGGARPGLVMLALAMGGFAIGTAEFAVMSLLPYFSVGLGIDAPTAGHVISAYALGVVCGAPIIAVLGARFPRKQLLIGLMILFALGNGLSALAPTYHSMLLLRFISGLPHGAYFGVAALVAASLVPPGKRTQAVARVMTGLTVATIIGVPLANWLGLVVGWRWAFGVVALVAGLTALLVWSFAPQDRPPEGAGPLRELGALRTRQVWLTLGVGAIGFGGLFAVYSYVASTLLNVTHVSPAVVPIVLAVFGVGMTLGNLAAAWAADRALIPTVAALLVGTAVSLLFYSAVATNVWLLSIAIFFIGCGGALGSVLQIRLMDVAGDAQMLAAALHHSAFNLANAIGPLVAGMAIAAGFGWASTGWVGSLLALGGLAMLGIALLDEKLSGHARGRAETLHPRTRPPLH
jgi:DHA1 family inner membrane transport protein